MKKIRLEGSLEDCVYQVEVLLACFKLIQEEIDGIDLHIMADTYPDPAKFLQDVNNQLDMFAKEQPQ